MENGDYVFDGDVPARSGRHLIYSIWQRSDSPEAFYTCSDVVFGKDSGAGAAAPAASAPSDQEIADGAGKSSVEHHHGAAGGSAEPQTEESAAPAADASSGGNGPEAKGGATKPLADENLAETGGDSTTPYIAMGGAAVLAVGAATMFASVRRRSVTGGRHSR